MTGAGRGKSSGPSRPPNPADKQSGMTAGAPIPDVSRETSAVASAISGRQEFQAQFNVSRETSDRLEVYAALLERWQKTINLVAPNTLHELWHRHFADSAQLFRLIPADASRLVDLGSGAGFPGLVLAILAVELRGTGRGSPPLHVSLVESDTRKSAFLREVARQLGIAVDIMPTRIESIPKSASVAVDVITSRALAPLPRLLELAEPLFSPGTVALFPKGRSVEDEVAEAREAWRFSLQLEESVTGDGARIAVIRNLERRQAGA